MMNRTCVWGLGALLTVGWLLGPDRAGAQSLPNFGGPGVELSEPLPDEPSSGAKKPPARPAAAKPAFVPAARPAATVDPTSATHTTSGTVTNVFVETELKQALQDVAQQTGTRIVAGQDVEGTINCELTEASLDQALELLLAGTDYIATRLPNYILVSSPDSKSPAFREISKLHRLRLSNVPADKAITLLSPKFKDYVQAEPLSGLVCITAPEPVANRIIEDLKEIDSAPRQLLLDARVVVLEKTDLLNLGLQWTWPKVSAGAFSNSGLHGADATGANWPWGLQVGYTPDKAFTNSLLLTLNLLTSNDQATVLASPQVTAQESKQAKIAVTTEEYFEIMTRGYYSDSELQKVEAGTTLGITPHVSDTSEITLNISTEVSDVVSRGEQGLPVVTRRKADSVVRVEDGGTVAVAGLVDSRTRQTLSKTPYLSRIPVVGKLFDNTNTNDTSRQVAVFVTARLMKNDGLEQSARDMMRRPQKPVDPELFRSELSTVLREKGMAEEAK